MAGRVLTAALFRQSTVTKPFTRLSAAMLLEFMVPATFHIHGFYRYRGPEYEHHLVGFFQNLTMSGGLVLLLPTGPGRWSLDARLSARAVRG